MSPLLMPFTPRFITFTLCIIAVPVFGIAWIADPHPVLAICFIAAAFLTAVGIHDLNQTNHSILRNYPVAAHIRFIFEEIRPEMRQYLFEGDQDGMPFSRDQRTVVYQRAKKVQDVRPFGTMLDVYSVGYEWVAHSIAPRPLTKDPFRIMIGDSECTKPYSASVFNISAMSFGALSANAIRALNGGAKRGGFAHDTGEGGFSPYHRENGGDIIWEIGSGYFGARNPDGTFSPERFAEVAATDQIKMVELKLSQGAKPGHGGVLPAPKVTPEIALTRGVPVGEDCVSPSQHSAFSTPIEMMHFIAEMRRLSGGKPAGFKLCIGQPVDVRARIATERRGFVIPKRTARMVSEHDFARYRWILAMDHYNLDAVTQMRPERYAGHLELLGGIDGQVPPREVPDPYFGSLAGFDQTLDQIEAGCIALLRRLTAPG